MKKMSRYSKELIKSLIPQKLVAYKLKATVAPTLLLTFDDGPHETITPQVLAQLRRFKIRALFFVLGEQAERYPNLLREIDREGHFVGNHTFSHPKVSGCSFTEIRDQIIRCQDSVEEIIGKRPKFFRPPEGHITPTQLAATFSAGLRTVNWSNEGGEWGHQENQSATNIAVKLLERSRPSQIILLHDNNPKMPDILERSLFVLSTSYAVSPEISELI